MWQNKYKKAITLSYDDGIKQDIRLVQLLNKYHLKATFNINTGLSDSSFDFFINGHRIEHMSFEDMISLYHGHEIAVHTVTHPFLTSLSDREIEKEIVDDITNIDYVFKQKPVGMAYPYGSYDDRVVDCVKASGLKYARTVESSYQTIQQTDLFRFKPTCHHNDPKLDEIINHFFAYEGDEPQILYLWGHSYEADVDQLWDYLDNLFKKISGHSDVFYGTNREVLLQDILLMETCN